MKRAYKKKLIIGGILIGILALVHYFNAGRYITLASIKENRALLQQMIARNYGLFVLGYLGVYIMATMFSLPVSAVLSVAGGFFFGTLCGLSRSPAIYFRGHKCLQQQNMRRNVLSGSNLQRNWVRRPASVINAGSVRQDALWHSRFNTHRTRSSGLSNLI